MVTVVVGTGSLRQTTFLLVKHRHDRHPKTKTKAQAHRQYQTMSGKDGKAPNGALTTILIDTVR